MSDLSANVRAYLRSQSMEEKEIAARVDRLFEHRRDTILIDKDGKPVSRTATAAEQQGDIAHARQQSVVAELAESFLEMYRTGKISRAEMLDRLAVQPSEQDVSKAMEEQGLFYRKIVPKAGPTPKPEAPKPEVMPLNAKRKIDITGEE